MLLALLVPLALAGTWRNGNVDLPETLEEIMTVEYAGKLSVTAKSGGQSVAFPSQPIHVGACASAEHKSGLRYTACLSDDALEITFSGGEPAAVAATITDRDDKTLYRSALTEQAEVQRENTQLRR